MKKLLIIYALLFLIPVISWGWGFFAHQQINKMAVFTLPPEMIPFYKKHIHFLSENAVNPDKRRHAVKNEAPRHYIDLDVYKDSRFSMPKYWHEAKERYTVDTLLAHGIVPWHIYLMKKELTEAFMEKNVAKILRLSADIGHYIADAHVPLHTTRNYNGQLTNQHGIHGLWESRLPELFFDDYDFFMKKAEYIKDVQQHAWQTVYASHRAVDSVLTFEKNLTQKYSPDKKYSFEDRGGTTVKVYSSQFSKDYHKLLHGQVERRLRASVKMVGDIWYTAWVDAGQPDLNMLLNHKLNEEELREMKKLKEKDHKGCEHGYN